MNRAELSGDENRALSTGCHRREVVATILCFTYAWFYLFTFAYLSDKYGFKYLRTVSVCLRTGAWFCDADLL